MKILNPAKNNDNQDIFAIVSTVRALLLINLNTKEVIPLEFNRSDYYGISWFPNGEKLVLSHSGMEYARFTDFSSYAQSEIGFLSCADLTVEPFLSAPHQILCASDGRVVCTNTGRNAISVVDLNKPGYFQEIRLSSPRWDISLANNMVGDHLNSIFEKNGFLYVIAHGNDNGSVLATLSYPELKLILLEPIKNRKYLHNIWVTDEGQRISCGSDKGELIELNTNEVSVLWKAGTPIFTRGLAASSEFVLVGESQEEVRRELRHSTMSALWLIDRKTWKALDYFYLGAYGGVHEVRILNLNDEAHHGVPFNELNGLLSKDVRKRVAEQKIKISDYAKNSQALLLDLGEEVLLSSQRHILSADTNFYKIEEMSLHSEALVPQKKILLSDNWSNIENWGVWSTGEIAALKIASENLPEKFSMELTYVGFVTVDYNKQHFEIYNERGKLLKKCDYEYSTGLNKILVELDKIEDSSVNGLYISIIIKMLNPVSPQKLNQSKDSRLLGFGLHSLRVFG